MKLSVITINYNHAQGLQRTLESVRKQSFEDYEHIIIDGASTDGSMEVIRDYESEANAKVVVVSEPDKGIYNAMNKGIALAKGEYLNFLNSGDCYYESSSLKNIFSQSSAVDCLIGIAIFVYNNHEVVFCDASSGMYDYEFFMKGSLPHQAMFIKNSVFERFGGYDESLKIVSDWKHSVETIYFGGITTQYLPVKVCLYESNGISMSEGMTHERKKVADRLFHPSIQKDMDKLLQYKYELAFVRQSKITRSLYDISLKLSSLIIKVRSFVK
jgi:glycosyltransferase involved in cell wall biosynthesis